MEWQRPSLIELGWYLASVILLGAWLRRTRGGRDAFERAPERGNCLTGVDVLFLVVVYVLGGAVCLGAIELMEKATSGEGVASWSEQDAEYLAQVGLQFLLTGVMIIMARRRFDGGIEGFGLTLKRWGRTVWVSSWMFVVGTGLTIITFMVTLLVCGMAGYEEVQRHTILESLGDSPSGLTVGLLIISAVVAAPLAEELFFRGVLQTCLVKVLGRRGEGQRAADGSEGLSRAPGRTEDYCRWLGIAGVSVMFAVSHGHWQHWPALFVLGGCLGYTYERYGNLIVPVTVHSLFNAMQVAATLLVGNGEM